MNRIEMSAKVCGRRTSNDAYFSNSWSSGVKTAEYAMATGVKYCGPAKTSHKGFCLATLEKLMKYWSGGSYIVMKITPKVPGGRPLLDIG